MFTANRQFSHVLIILFSVFFLLQVVSADEESLGQQAERSGNLRQALTHYVSALQQLWGDSKHSQPLLERILSLSRKLNPPPIVPEEAKRSMARGRAAVKAAQSAADFAAANIEFSTAAYYAPWLAETYYNSGVVRDKAGMYDEAIWALRMYLQAKPGAADKEQVRGLIYEIEYRKEKAQGAENEKRVEAANPAVHFNGTWEGQRDGTYSPGPSDNRSYGKDTFQFDGSGTNIQVVLLSTQHDYNNSYFATRPQTPIGEVVFQLNLEGNSITGVYLQSAFNNCNRGNQIPLTGNVFENGDTLILKFVETYISDKYASNGATIGCNGTYELGRPTITIRRIQ